MPKSNKQNSVKPVKKVFEAVTGVNTDKANSPLDVLKQMIAPDIGAVGGGGGGADSDTGSDQGIEQLVASGLDPQTAQQVAQGRIDASTAQKMILQKQQDQKKIQEIKRVLTEAQEAYQQRVQAEEERKQEMEKAAEERQFKQDQADQARRQNLLQQAFTGKLKQGPGSQNFEQKAKKH